MTKLKRRINHLLKCFYFAARDMINHDGIEHAGYLSFLSILAFFPFLVFLVSLAGFIGESDIGLQFVNIILQQLPEKVAFTLKPRIEEIISGPPENLMTLAILGAIWTSSSSVEGLRTVLNRAFRVKSPPPYIWRRLLSIIQFLIITLFVLLIMMFIIFLPVAIDKSFIIEHIVSGINPMLNFVRIIFTYLIIFICICLSYMIIPNTKNIFKKVVPGSIITLIGWVISAKLLSMYLGNFKQVNLIYGSLGGIIASLLFSYISSIIFIYGAEFNYHFHSWISPPLNRK